MLAGLRFETASDQMSVCPKAVINYKVLLCVNETSAFARAL